MQPQLNNNNNPNLSLSVCQDCHILKQLLIFTSSTPTICQQCFDIRQQSLFIPINMIIQKLFLGSLQSVQKQHINKHNIKSICSCGLFNGLDGKISKIYKQSNNNGDKQIQYKNIIIGDTPEQNIIQYFQQFYLWVKQQFNNNSNVLVHCAAGASRSASFVISFLIKQRQISYEDALKYVKSKRPCVQPNDGFKKQLKQWQEICEKQYKQQ